MQKKAGRKDLVSVIIPSYKQAKTIVEDVARIERTLKQLEDKYEIIIVVDGNVDKTIEKAMKIASKNIKVVGYKNNRGKGYAIRYGMVRSKGTILGFIDAGMDLNPNGILPLITYLKREHMDIVIGSKRHKASRVNYPFNRKLLSILSQLFIRFLFGLNVKDTQVGMKFFQREVLEAVLPRLLVKQFAIDIEILVVAYYLGYRKIGESPVEITHNFTDSIVSENLFRSITRTFLDTLAIFYRLKILHYYDNTSRRKWKFDPELSFRVNIG